MPAVPPEEFLYFLPLKGSKIKWKLYRINEQNDGNRRIGLGTDFIGCVKRKDFLRLAVVQQRKVLGFYARDLLS